MAIMNTTFLNLQECNEINDSLLATIDSCHTAFSLFNRIDSGYKVEISQYKIAVSDRDTVIARFTDVDKKKDKQIRKLKAQKALLGGLSVVLTASALALLILL